MIEHTTVSYPKGLKNDKTLPLNNEQTNGHYDHSEFKRHIYNRLLVTNGHLIILNSKCIPKTNESIMKKRQAISLF